MSEFGPQRERAERSLLPWLEGRWKNLHRDDQGTSLTEFVITLPIFLVILAGVIDLGNLINTTVVVEIESQLDLLDQLDEVSSSGISFSSSMTDLLHTQPSAAAVSAAVQVERYQPRQKTPAGRALVRLYEHSTYSLWGMALSGHWGESNMRVRRLQDLGIELAGVEDLVTSHPEELFGGARGSGLAQDLLYDGPNARFSEGQNQSTGVITNIMGPLNQVITTSGMRGAMAAGTRYGTVTGVSEYDVQVNRGIDRTFSAHMTATVGPYADDDGWNSAMRATAVTRLTFLNPRYGVYNDTLRFKGSNPFKLEEFRTLEVPDLGSQFSAPLNYDADLYD